MAGTTPTEADLELVATARATLREHYAPERHTTGAALRTASGAVYTGVSLKGGTGKADEHAEPVALARAVMDGASSPEAVAAVQPAGPAADPTAETRVVSACGVCREFLVAYNPELWVLLPGDGQDGGEEDGDEGGGGGVDDRDDDGIHKRRLRDLRPA